MSHPVRWFISTVKFRREPSTVIWKVRNESAELERVLVLAEDIELNTIFSDGSNVGVGPGHDQQTASRPKSHTEGDGKVTLAGNGLDIISVYNFV